MFKKIIGLFSKKGHDQPEPSSDSEDKLQDFTLKGEDPRYSYYPYYLEFFINRSNFIKEDLKPAVASMFEMDQGLVTLDDDNLTLDEKKAYKLNTRSKINRKAYSVLTEEGIKAYSNPKYVFSDLVQKARNFSFLKSDLESMRRTSFEYVKLGIANTGLECDRCKALDGKEISVNEDLDALLLDNCTSDDCKASFFLRPVWQDI